MISAPMRTVSFETMSAMTTTAIAATPAATHHHDRETARGGPGSITADYL